MYIFISFSIHIKKCKLTMEDMKIYQKEKLDLMAFGQAVKEAREKKGLSREQLAEMLDRSVRHTQYIETRGQHPSLQIFYEIVRLFGISTLRIISRSFSVTRNVITRFLSKFCFI